MRRRISLLASAGLLALLAQSRPAEAAQLRLLMPLGRSSYQTNEIVDLSVVRSDTRPLAAGRLIVSISGPDGSTMSFAFSVSAAQVNAGAARSTENLHLDGRLLRPGAYSVSVASDGAAATASFTIYSHVRKSTYRTIHWGVPAATPILGEGDAGMGFNLVMSTDVLHQEPSIAAGVDVMGNCLMGGGHQHDLRRTNDWSDPYVYIGAIQRGIDRAFAFRTMPNAIGAHLHDEPGLTWLKNPHTGLMSNHDIAPQRAAYERAFGHPAIWSDRVDVHDVDQYARWTEENDFKLGFMDAFWKAADEAIARLKPGFLPVTQSQYGWSAIFDGYYFNVARSLPIISGHGGYDDYGLRNLNPSFFLEMAMPRQLDKPNWYMPEWYGDISGDEFRFEHNLSFITGIQGMSTPWNINAKSASAAAVIETNHLYQQLGTIFTAHEYTSQDLTVLYSKSNQYYLKDEGQPGLDAVYLATKLLQYPIQAVLEEDVLDGSLAAAHKVVILAGLVHLDAPVVDALEEFVRGGGAVLETIDCSVPIRGAVRVPVDPRGHWASQPPAFEDVLANAGRVAAALKPGLLRAGLRPALVSDVATIAAGKQVLGEIEYDFAVNFTAAPKSPPGGLGVPVATTAKLSLPDDGRPIYDAVAGKPAPLFTNASAVVTFGPGQMMALARPERPIGGVEVGTPVVSIDLTRVVDPVRVQIEAALVDTQRRLLAGTAPMEVKLIDPRGAVRYDVFRGAHHGVLEVDLPFAANDPAGNWMVKVTELLSGTGGNAAFQYHPAGQCGALAGRTSRATVFRDDLPNIYRFFRDHRRVTIVHGSSAAAASAARRLVEILAPYNVTAVIESMSDANRALPLSDEQAATWCGSQAAGLLDTAARKTPAMVGFNLTGPTVLIGNVSDNPLIAFLEERHVLPYGVTADFPGPGHGLVAWNLMTLGHDIETVALIANDAAGIAEAVGTAFQIAIGVEPLTPYVLPLTSEIRPAYGP